MKRRIKLTTTILAMTLVLALMTFSVFAATAGNGTVTIDGNFGGAIVKGSFGGFVTHTSSYSTSEMPSIDFGGTASVDYTDTAATITGTVTLGEGLYNGDALEVTIEFTLNTATSYLLNSTISLSASTSSVYVTNETKTWNNTDVNGDVYSLTFTADIGNITTLGTPISGLSFTFTLTVA